MTLDHACQIGRHPQRERGDDLYETPACAVHALRRVEVLPHYIWECACGPGAIVKVLRDVGHAVVATDLVDYGCPDAKSKIDFLLERHAPFFIHYGIVTNPPYKLAGQFVEHALQIGVPYIAMLLRLAFLESGRRSNVLDTGMLARVHVFKNRLPMMHRHSWSGPRASSAVPFAWFVWSQSHRGPATIDRISWEPVIRNKAE